MNAATLGIRPGSLTGEQRDEQVAPVLVVHTDEHVAGNDRAARWGDRDA